MKKGSSKVRNIGDLRKRAEKKIPVSINSIGKMSAPDIQKLVHELGVHQIELEMQNEALQESQVEAAKSEQKYSALYDFAPVGYFTLDRKGYIIEANVTGASLLGTEKRSLAKQPFQRFIVPGHLSIFQSHLQKVMETKSKRACKLRLVKKDGSSFDALLDTIAVMDVEGKFDYCQFAIADITEITTAEQVLEERLRFETLLFDLSARLMSTPLDQVDSEIYDALRQIKKFFQVDRCGLLEIQEERAAVRMTHAVYGKGVKRISEDINLAELVPWTYKKLVRGEYINISRLEDYPEEAQRDRQTHEAMGTKSILTIPLLVGGRLSRMIMIHNTRRQQTWPEEYISRLLLLGVVLANAIERRDNVLKLQEQLKFETLLSDISRHFVNLPADQVDSEIEDAQRRVCECLGLDLSALWQWSIETPRILTMTHIYRPLGGPPLPEPMYANEYFPWCQEQLEAGKIIAVSSMNELPAEAARDQEVWRHLGIKTTLTFPLTTGGGLSIGALSFNSMQQERTWPEALIQRLQLVSQIFINALTRKWSETALRENEARLSLTTEAVGAGLWIMDVDTGKVWVSPKSRELFHFAPDGEIHYESYFRVIHPDDRERVHREVQDSLRSGENLHCDYRIVLPDGSIRWIVARGQRFLKSPREPARMIGLSFDITERKEVELQLSESQTLLSSLINSTPDMIWSVDAEHFGLITFNRSLSEYFLHERAITIKAGMRPEDLLPANYAQQWHMFYRQALEEGSFITEYSTSGGNRTLRLNINSLRHDDCVFSLSVFAQDITKRKQAAEALRESERRMTDITFSMADWVWEVDENGVYTYSSSRGDELFGHVLGKTPFDFMPADEAKKVAAMFSEIAANKAPIKDLENWNIRKHGEMICLLTSGVPILDEEGNLKGYRGVDKDITERKQMETRLRKQLAEIEKLKFQMERENIYLREEIKTELGFGKIIGGSDALKYVLFRAEQVAPTDATVLILGETGVGKGLVAHAIHQFSARKDKPMITVNCAALPANLIESELFGREKGAFTGAHAKQVGRFEVADGGTIFLDEIGELPLELQSKLLRVLQDGEFERLGSPRTIKVDVRVITSTSRNLKAEMRTGRFREDLYYRLNVFPVSLPPLRARVEDIPELANYFIDKYSRKFGRRFETVATDTMQILKAYQWPGNVRELEHIIERAVITSPQPVFRLVDHLEEEPVKAEEGTLKEFEEMAREHILQVLQKTRWKIDGEGGAAAMLGLNPSTLRFRIKKLGIKRP